MEIRSILNKRITGKVGQKSRTGDNIRRKEKKGRPITRWRDEIIPEKAIFWHKEAENKIKWEASGAAYSQKWTPSVQPC